MIRNLFIVAVMSFALGGAMGCNALLSIESVEPTSADAGVDGMTCVDCVGPGRACIAGKCVDRTWQNGPIAERPECSRLPNTGDSLMMQLAAGLVWSTVPILATKLATAEQQCAGIDIDGFRELHVATRVELLSLFDFRSATPLESSCTRGRLSTQLATVFCSASSPFAGALYCVEGATGRVVVRYTDEPLNFLCAQPLRGEPRARFEPGTSHVYDRVTGLTWQQDIPLAEANSNQRDMTEIEATAYCRGLGAGWTVPTVKQLQSLIDESRTMPPMIDPKYFPGLQRETHWTADVAAGAPDAFWVEFMNGTTFQATKPGVVMKSGVRCVHPGRL